MRSRCITHPLEGSKGRDIVRLDKFFSKASNVPGLGAPLHSIGNFCRVPRTDGSCEEDRLAATSLGNCVLKRILQTRRGNGDSRPPRALVAAGSLRDPYAVLRIHSRKIHRSSAPSRSEMVG